MVLLDLSAGFDTVNHDTLLRDLVCLGKTGSEPTLFRSYLTNRKFRVIVNEEHFEIYIIKYRVPKGTISGPALFHFLLTHSAVYVELLQRFI